MRATEHQRVKRLAFAYLHASHPTDIQQAPERKREPMKPPLHLGLQLVTYLDKGRLRGKWVDPMTAQSLENYTDGQNNAVVLGMSFMNTFFKDIFTRLNVGFQMFNVRRDFKRFWKNMPQVTRRDAVRLYWRARELAAVRAYGLASPESSRLRQAYRTLRGKPATAPTTSETQAYQDLLEAERAGILGVNLSDARTHEIEAAMILNILAAAGVVESAHAGDYARLTGLPLAPPKARGPISKTWNATVQPVLDAIASAGDFIETLPTAAGMYEFKGEGAIADIPADQRHYIRTKLGSPDFLAGGTYKPWSNNLLLFSNAITQAWRSDLEVATDPTTAAGFWWKTVQANVLPKMFMWAAVMAAAGAAGGGDDDDEKSAAVRWIERELARVPWLVDAGQVLRKVSEYDRANYLIIPLGLDARGNAIIARIPQDDTGRFIGGLAHKAFGFMAGDRQFWRMFADTISYGAGQFPAAPPWASAFKSSVAYASGENPYDPFRQRFLFTQDEQKARPSFQALKKFAGWEFQQLGGGIVWKFYPGDERPVEKTAGQVILDLPVLSNIVGRVVKVTNYGEVERIRGRGAVVESKRAGERLDLQAAVHDTLRQYWKLPKDQQTLATQRQMAIALSRTLYPHPADRDERDKNDERVQTKLELSILHGTADTLSDLVVSAGSNEAKIAMILGERSSFAPEKFEQWLSAAVRRKVISPQVRIDVHKKMLATVH